MQGKFIEAVERPSGRNVLAYISKHHVGPDIELFLLTGPNIRRTCARRARAPDAE
jgi:hypothetical protein